MQMHSNCNDILAGTSTTQNYSCPEVRSSTTGGHSADLKQPPPAGNWRKFSIKRCHQIWPKLTLYQSILYRKVKTPTMHEEKLPLITPVSIQKQLLKSAHDNAGHQGTDWTMTCLSEAVYRVGMCEDVNTYCSHCVTCQRTEAATYVPTSSTTLHGN